MNSNLALRESAELRAPRRPPNAYVCCAAIDKEGNGRVCHPTRTSHTPHQTHHTDGKCLSLTARRPDHNHTLCHRHCFLLLSSSPHHPRTSPHTHHIVCAARPCDTPASRSTTTRHSLSSLSVQCAPAARRVVFRRGSPARPVPTQSAGSNDPSPPRVHCQHSTHPLCTKHSCCTSYTRCRYIHSPHVNTRRLRTPRVCARSYHPGPTHARHTRPPRLTGSTRPAHLAPTPTTRTSNVYNFVRASVCPICPPTPSLPAHSYMRR